MTFGKRTLFLMFLLLLFSHSFLFGEQSIQSDLNTIDTLFPSINLNLNNLENQRELEEKQRAIEELTRNAIEYCDGNEQYIEQSVSTVRELQAQIKLLEDCYNRVKLCLFGIRNNITDNISDK